MLDIGHLKLTLDIAAGNAIADLTKSVASAAINCGKKIAQIGVDFTKQIIQSYSKFEQLSGGVEKLYNQSADKMKKYAMDAAKTCQLSVNEYMETATQFSASLIDSLGGDTDKAVEYTDKAMRQMADNASVFGTDMEMIQTAYKGFARESYLALDNLKLGYAGTKEGMQQLLKDAEALSGVKYDISSYSDIIDAIDVIQEKMGVAGNAAEEASHTIEGSINTMKSSWENFKIAVATGEGVEEATQNLVESVKNVLQNLIPVAMEVWRNVCTALKPFFADIDATVYNLTGTNINGWKVLINQNIVSPLKKDFEKLVEDIKSYVAAHKDEWIKKAGEVGAEIGKSMGEAILSAVREAWAEAMHIGEEGYTHMSSGYLDRDHGPTPRWKQNAIGTDYIPYDGYVTTLHKGERILTASEAERFDSSDSAAAVSNVFNITVPNNPNAFDTAVKLHDLVIDAEFGLV